MPAVDFSEWAVPDLAIALGGRDFTVRPPSVEGARALVALTVAWEVQNGLTDGELPDDVQTVIDAHRDQSLADLSLGADVHAQLVEAGYPPETIRRVAMYALLYWTRGRSRADYVARTLWAAPDEPGTAGGDDPKAP
jgi:hypothetical protein